MDPDLDETARNTDAGQPHDGGPPDPSAGITDEELAAILADQGADIAVVGCGGGGCNTVDRLHGEAGADTDLVAINTDVQHLAGVRADAKLLIGEDETGGKGAGSLPQVGERAAAGARGDIDGAVAGADMVFVAAGLGGGTGTGAAPVVAEAAREAGALTVAVVTMPFEAEGEERRRNAEAGLERLRSAADTVIVIRNDRLLDAVGKLPVRQAFEVADEVLARSIVGITDLVDRSGMVNLDFADVRTVLEGGGLAMIGFGESDSERKAEDAVASALRSPMLDVDVSGAGAALVNVTGGPGMSIAEAEGVAGEVHDRIRGDARIIWGTGVDESLGDTVRAMVVLTGGSSPGAA